MGRNDPYHVPGQKWTHWMKEYLLSDRCADLAVIITGGMKPEFYIRKRIISFLPNYKRMKKTHPVSLFPLIVVSGFFHWTWAINR